jgi:predicted DNA-binding transcriptional regulator AlpA
MRASPTSGCHRCSERLIGVKETAFMLGIAQKSVRNKLSLGVFPIRSYLFGGRRLFKLSEVLEFIKNLS